MIPLGIVGFCAVGTLITWIVVDEKLPYRMYKKFASKY